MTIGDVPAEHNVFMRSPSPLLTSVVRVDGEWRLDELRIDVIADGHNVHFIRFARLRVRQRDVRFIACRFLLHPILTNVWPRVAYQSGHVGARVADNSIVDRVVVNERLVVLGCTPSHM